MTAFRKLKLMATAMIGAAAFGATVPAFAGQCPAGQQGANELADRPTAPKGVEDKVQIKDFAELIAERLA